MEASDERVIGSSDVVNSCEFWADGNGADCSGTTTITNDGGTWTGEYSGTTSWSAEDPEHHHVIDTVLVGTGDYEGLRFVYRLTGGDSFPWDFTGTIEPIHGS